MIRDSFLCNKKKLWWENYVKGDKDSIRHKIFGAWAQSSPFLLLYFSHAPHWLKKISSPPPLVLNWLPRKCTYLPEVIKKIESQGSCCLWLKSTDFVTKRTSKKGWLFVDLIIAENYTSVWKLLLKWVEKMYWKIDFVNPYYAPMLLPTLIIYEFD